MFKLACLLTGYPYDRLKNHTPWSKRKVSILAICLVIATFVSFGNAFCLTTLALQHPVHTGILVGFIFAILIFLIERTIAMALLGGGSGIVLSRIALAGVIAWIGGLGGGLAIFTDDVQPVLADQKRAKVDSLQRVLLQRDSIAQLTLRSTINDKNTLYITQLDRLNGELNGDSLSSGAPGSGSVAAAKSRIADTLKADRNRDNSQLATLISDQAVKRDSTLRKAEADFNPGLIARARILHKVAFADWFSASFFVAVCLFFFFIDLLVVILKRVLPPSEYEIEELRAKELHEARLLSI